MRGKGLTNRTIQRMRIARYAIACTCEQVEGHAKRGQPVVFAGGGRIIIGEGVVFGMRISPGFYTTYSYVDARTPDAVIRIGDRVLVNNGVSIISEGAGITIGADALIGVGVEILDTDFHDLRPAFRQSGSPAIAPVEIGANVFLGSGVRVLKGVSIGRDSVIGAGSVVVSSIPERTVAAGNPAKVIRELIL